MYFSKTLGKMVLLFIFSITTFVSAQDFNWTKSFGGVKTDYANSLAVDSSGSVFLTGEFFTSVTFNPLPVITSGGNVDYVVAKLDSLGNGIWARKGGGTLTDRGFCIKLDNQGNVITCGVFYGASTFEGGANPNVVLTSKGNLDGFIAKYDPLGNLLWIKQQMSVAQVQCNKIDVDCQNNILVTGYYGSSTVDTMQLGNIVLHSNGQRDIFTAKYDPNGNILWAVTAGGSANLEQGNGITVDSAGNVYNCGIIAGAANFGGIDVPFDSTNDAYFAKYSSSGNIVWVKTFSGPKAENARDISLDENGHLYVCGDFDSICVFGTNTIHSNGALNSFLAKMDTSGNLLWVRTGGGATTGVEYGNSIVIDKSGNPCITGSFEGTGSFSGQQVTSAGLEDAYFAKYDANGNLLNLKRAGGATADRGLEIDVDPGNNILISGRYSAVADFGSINLTSAGTDDMFLTKLGNNNLPVELISFTGSSANGKTVLKWTTATEINNYGFEIYRGTDKLSFDKIGFVKGNGNSNIKHFYSFSDDQHGKFYYKLKQIDFNGSPTFSQTINVDNTMPVRFELYPNFPNPFNPSTNFKFNIPEDSKVVLSIFNILGERVSVITGDYKMGTNNIVFNAGNLGSGMYIYELTSKNFDGNVFKASGKMLLLK